MGIPAFRMPSHEVEAKTVVISQDAYKAYILYMDKLRGEDMNKLLKDGRNAHEVRADHMVTNARANNGGKRGCRVVCRPLGGYEFDHITHWLIKNGFKYREGPVMQGMI